MPETVRSRIDVRIGGGPSMGAGLSKSVAAYDKLSVTVAALEDSNPGTATVALQPGDTEQVVLLMITATRYHESDLEYDLGSETIVLDGPQLFTGAGMLGRFTTNPETMSITNNLDTPVTVSVLVARNAS